MTTLLDIWKDRRDFIDAKSIEQLLSISGDGRLLDGSEASNQLRDLFSNIPAKNIERYIDECLSSPFTQSGLVLQDLINEIGRRLGFSVEPGYYRGGGSKIGFDGIWKAKDGYAFVVEVKTTDAYQINLDTQAGYRQRLIKEERIDKDRSSILVIVGRKDTGGLEAQTRGSRHAWDVRIISAGSLIKLMQVKESLNDIGTVQQMQEILKPLEYTRVDRLIDIIFTTSEDLQSDEVDLVENGSNEEIRVQVTPVKYHEACINLVSSQLQVPLIKQGRCAYTSADQSVRVLCIVSKQYQQGQAERYWYAFHPSQQEFLNEGDSSFIALGCGSADQIILLPTDDFFKHLPKMRTTESKGRFYWHVEIFKKGSQFLLNKPTSEGIDITQYRITEAGPKK